MGKCTIVVDLNSLLNHYTDVNPDLSHAPFKIENVFLNQDIMSLIMNLSHKVDAYHLVFLTESYGKPGRSTWRYGGETYKLRDSFVQKIFNQSGFGVLSYKDYALQYQREDDSIELMNDVDLADAVFISADPVILAFAQKMQAGVVPAYQYADLCENGCRRLTDSLSQASSDSTISIYLDVDNTLLDRNRSLLSESTVLNDSVLDKLKSLNSIYSEGITFNIITARIESWEDNPTCPLSVESVKAQLLDVGIPIKETIFTGCLIKGEDGRFVRSVKTDKVNFIRECEIRDKSSFVVFVDDNLGEIEAANCQVENFNSVFIPLLVNSGGELREGSLERILKYINDCSDQVKLSKLGFFVAGRKAEETDVHAPCLLSRCKSL